MDELLQIQTQLHQRINTLEIALLCPRNYCEDWISIAIQCSGVSPEYEI